MAAYTKKQRNILSFISKFQKEQGVSPTLEELSKQFMVTRVTIFQHISSLERKGAIKRRTHEARSITILDPEYSPKGYILPMLGTIEAGKPLEAIEDPIVFDLTVMVPLDEDHFVLKVRGTSMIEDGIRQGDFVIIRKVGSARNGQTVVAVLPNGEATLKRFYHEGDRIRLQPANETMPPIYVPECEIRGKVVGIFRKM